MRSDVSNESNLSLTGSFVLDERTPLTFGLTPLGHSMHQVTNHGTIQLRATNEDGYITESDVGSTTDEAERGRLTPSLIDRVVKPGGVAECTASLLSSMITPAILSLPLAMAAGGIPFFLASTAFCIVMTVFSTRFLCIASMESGCKTYDGVTRYFLGHSMRQLARGVLFVYNIGSSVVYLRFIADSMVPVLQLGIVPSFMHDQGGVLIMVLVWFIVTPLTFDSKISSMKNKSFLSNALTLFIVVVVVYRYFYPLPYMLSKANLNKDAGGGLQYWLMPQFFVAPMIVFSFEIQSNLVPIYGELSEPSIKAVTSALSITLVIATALYTTIGIFGAATFGSLVSGNILNNYDPVEDVLISLCLVACSISAAVCFVFVLFPCRQALLGAHEHNQSTLVKFGGGVSMLACLLAVFVPNVGAAISLLGSMCSSTLSMTLPSLFVLKLKQSGSPLLNRYDAMAASVLLPAGLIFGILGTIMSVAVLVVV